MTYGDQDDIPYQIKEVLSGKPKDLGYLLKWGNARTSKIDRLKQFIAAEKENPLKTKEDLINDMKIKLDIATQSLDRMEYQKVGEYIEKIETIIKD